LNGYRIPLEALTYEVATSVTDGSHSRAILLVAHDKCPLCKEETSKWRTLLSKIKTGNDCDVVLVAVGDPSVFKPVLADLLRDKRPYKLLVVRDTAAFRNASGILSTPSTLVLDGDQRVRVVSKHLTSVGESMIAEYFSTTSQ